MLCRHRPTARRFRAHAARRCRGTASTTSCRKPCGKRRKPALHFPRSESRRTCFVTRRRLICCNPFSTIIVIALWLGHEGPLTTHIYVEADLKAKEQALQNVAPAGKAFPLCRPGAALLAFLV